MLAPPAPKERYYRVRRVGPAGELEYGLCWVSASFSKDALGRLTKVRGRLERVWIAIT